MNALTTQAEAGVALAKRAVDQQLQLSPEAAMLRWAKGESSLMELKGYAPEELYAIAQHAYTLFLNGKVRDARVVFEGLIAIDPRNDYYYRALGVVYHRLGDAEGAIRQFGHALIVNPRSAAAYVNRAEVHIARRDTEAALADLDAALRTQRDLGQPIPRKAVALRALLRRQRRAQPSRP